MATQATLFRVAINNILLATDFSHESQSALQCALALAKRYESKLFIAHAVLPDADTSGVEVQVPLNDLMQSDAERNFALLEQSEQLRSFPHEMVLRSGVPSKVLSEILSDEHIDLVVMGTHGRGGLDKLRLGSTTENMMRHAHCPVLSVGAHARVLSPERFGHILYATDFSAGSRRALTYALSLAEEDGAEVTLLYVVEGHRKSEAELIKWKCEGREKLSRLVPPFVDLASRPEAEVETGVPGKEIVRLAESRDVDLICYGFSRRRCPRDALALEHAASCGSARLLPGVDGLRRVRDWRYQVCIIWRTSRQLRSLPTGRPGAFQPGRRENNAKTFFESKVGAPRERCGERRRQTESVGEIRRYFSISRFGSNVWLDG